MAHTMTSLVQPWRAHGGAEPIVPFDQQLDKFILWMGTWNHPQRCELVEKLLLHMDYEQYRFLWTVIQPTLHRDFMYSAQAAYPRANFQPVSTHGTRKLREYLSRKKRNTFHRVSSAYCEFPEEVIQKSMLPELSSIRQLSFDSQIRRKNRPHFSAKLELPKIGDRSQSLVVHSLAEHDDHEERSPLLRTSDPPVRRHIQQENVDLNHESSEVSAISLYKSMQLLPPNAIQVVGWYINEWNDSQRNEFLVKLVLSLDERQLFFISNMLAVKQYKDFISLLPIHISLRILSYLTPKQLVKASRVCKSWKKICERNELWKAKCKELNMNVSDYQPSTTAISQDDSQRPTQYLEVNYKKLLKSYLSTLDNWDAGKYREVELKGHTHNVLSVCLEEKRHNARLASGSLDKTIRVWDIKYGTCLMTLKGHTKGVWCLNFYSGSMLISGSYDSTIRIWNLQTGKCLKTLLGHDGPVWSIVRHENMLVSGSQDKTVKVWDIRKCALLSNLTGHQAPVFCLDMTKDGQYAFSASADHTVRIWNLQDESCQKVIYVNQSVAVMTVSYDQGFLACSYGEYICLYTLGANMQSAKLVKTYEEHQKRIESIRLNVTDTELGHGVIVSAGKDGFIKYWSLTDDTSIQTFKGSNEPITCVSFDKRRIVLASKENKIKIFDFGSP